MSMRRLVNQRDVLGAASAEVRKAGAARLQGMSQLIAAIDTSDLSPKAKAALDNAIQEAQAAADYVPTAGSMMSIGSTNLITNANPLGAATNLFQGDVAHNPSFLTNWGLDDSEKVDVSFIITRLSFHLSIFQTAEQAPSPPDQTTLRNSIVHGNWVLSAGETGETVIAKGAVADHMDLLSMQEILATSTDAGVVTLAQGAMRDSQDLDDRPWQGTANIPAGYPLRMLLTGAEGDAAITPAQVAAAMLQVSFQGVRLR